MTLMTLDHDLKAIDTRNRIGLWMIGTNTDCGLSTLDALNNSIMMMT